MPASKYTNNIHNMMVGKQMPLSKNDLKKVYKNLIKLVRPKNRMLPWMALDFECCCKQQDEKYVGLRTFGKF